jgi:hypothetical protein
MRLLRVGGKLVRAGENPRRRATYRFDAQDYAYSARRFNKAYHQVAEAVRLLGQVQTYTTDRRGVTHVDRAMKQVAKARRDLDSGLYYIHKARGEIDKT